MNTTLQTSSVFNDDRLDPLDFHERRSADGCVRPHWSSLTDQIESLGVDVMRQRSDSIEQFIRENGVTFHADEKVGAPDRPWKLSAIPFVIGSSEWQTLHDGLTERTLLLAEVLADLLGPQRLIREGVVPGELLWTNPYFYRAYHGLEKSQQKLHITAADVVRASDGQWRVTGDRTRAPSGLGYLLENRVVTSRAMPSLIRSSNTLRLASFFESLQEHLQSLAPSHRENPRVALLTPPSGSYREFEDTYLARYLGITLVQGSDLAVRGGGLNLKTLGGLQPIQVLWRHISDRNCDPLELDSRSQEGVTGLLRCIRRRSVAVVNTIGSGLVETPGLLPYLDAAQQFFFGGPLQLASAKTYWCGDPRHRSYVMDHLDQLIFRGAMAVTSEAPVMVSQLSAADRESFVQRLTAHPEKFIAQEQLRFSQTPVWIDGQVKSQKAALRTFQLLTPDAVHVMPGALARVGNDELELSRSPVCGQMTQDCWVTSESPVDQSTSLLPDSTTVIRLRRGGDELPSRVAEHLYWLGRYAERGEAIARVLRTTLARIAGEEKWDSLVEVRRLVYTLASMGQIEPGFAVDSFVVNLPHVEQTLPASVMDPDQPRGLIRTMESVMHNATAVRDRLSVDAFRILQRASRELTRPVTSTTRSGQSEIGIGEAIERVGILIVDLLALAGVTSESFVRTHAWQFLELGRRLERAEHTCELLITMLCPPTDEGKSICDAVLETTDSRMTYRSRYMNLVRLAPVIDLIVTDETNPRSLRFQLDRVAALMDKLPSVEGPVGLDAIQRIVLDLQYRITTADPMKLSETSADGTLETLKTLLTKLADDLPVLGEAINARYLIHTESKQLLTGTGR
ncbi:circularly permuted type 2 ATP-grasp protein [Stieleria sp. TO1_6]|uniref:circularly permuted type 2 ATP-grasp protein n=1 Tax=Stieleria tagensis TaxID=2956795 RepID=UPI00209AF201|nr:circularly permuted type 2 ATP-grasp protein [Stieleria tagensis]MCO8120299.1 circularly permuted type 2 ATP-grasp protein [Stieleria tagensis]